MSQVVEFCFSILREYLMEVCLLETSAQAPSSVSYDYGSINDEARVPSSASYDYGSINHRARAPSSDSYDYGSIYDEESPPPASVSRIAEITDLDLNVHSCKGNELFYDYTVSTIFN